MKLLMRLLREPLFHFTVIGGLIFAFYAAVNVEYPVCLGRQQDAEGAIAKLLENEPDYSIAKVRRSAENK
jgi:hypothetical protein